MLEEVTMAPEKFSREWFRQQGRRGRKLLTEKLTPAQRTGIDKKAAVARWSKRKRR